MQKTYQHPEAIVVEWIQENHLLAGTTDKVSSIGGNANLKYNGPGSVAARTKEDNGWDDWGEE